MGNPDSADLVRSQLSLESMTPAVNPKENVRKYIEAELLGNKDPFDLIDMKTGMPGGGISFLYNSLLKMAGQKDSVPQQSKVSEALGYWEAAMIDVVCDEEAYFTKTALGTTGTISEFMGTMLASCINITKSPHMKDGRYTNRFLRAVDYNGIVNGLYTRAYYDQFARQELLLDLLHKSQGSENRLSQDFWKQIEANEDFIFLSHRIAVDEGFSNANDLLVQALGYAWRKSEEGTPRRYDMASHYRLQKHFDGKTAADKFLASPEMRFEELFRASRSNVQKEYLWDFEQVSETKKDYVVLLDSVKDDTGLQVKYAHVGDYYSEESIIFDETTIAETDEVTKTVFKLATNFENFKQNYLDILSSKSSTNNILR